MRVVIEYFVCLVIAVLMYFLFISQLLHSLVLFLFVDRIQETSFSKIRVASNNAYRRIFGLSNRSSASAMYANYNICNFETILRRKKHL